MLNLKQNGPHQNRFGLFLLTKNSTTEHRVSTEIRLVPVFKFQKIIKEKTAKIHVYCCWEENCIFLTTSFHKMLKIWILVYWNYALYSRNFSFYIPFEYSSIPFFPLPFWGTFPTISYDASSISESFPPPNPDLEARTEGIL